MVNAPLTPVAGARVAEKNPMMCYAFVVVLDNARVPRGRDNQTNPRDRIFSMI
jgi:hypothetical protein